jgi:hypothetical protein
LNWFVHKTTDSFTGVFHYDGNGKKADYQNPDSATDAIDRSRKRRSETGCRDCQRADWKAAASGNSVAMAIEWLLRRKTRNGAVLWLLVHNDCRIR